MNNRLATDRHQLIIPPISKDCSNTFLERSFIYVVPGEWNKLSEDNFSMFFSVFVILIFSNCVSNIRYCSFTQNVFTGYAVN